MFTKESFKAANESGGSGGDFPTIPTGVYDVVVKRMEIKDAKQLTDEQVANGAVQSLSQTFTIGFAIHEDADEYAKQWIWYRQNIVKKDGMPNEIGMQGVALMLSKLSAGQFSIDHFETKINNEGEEEIINTEKVFNRFLDTEARFKVKYSKSGDYDNHEFTFQSLSKATYADAPPEGIASNNGSELEENVAAPVDEPKEGEAQIGDYVQFTNAKKVEELGTITQYVESNDPNIPSMLMIKPLAKTKPIVAVVATMCKLLPPETVAQIEAQNKATETAKSNGETEPPFKADSEMELEDDIVIDDTLPLVKGATVQALWQGEIYRGKVHKIDETEGQVVIAYNGKGRKHPIADVTVIG